MNGNPEGTKNVRKGEYVTPVDGSDHLRFIRHVAEAPFP
jgi:hypothetical protein